MSSSDDDLFALTDEDEVVVKKFLDDFELTDETNIELSIKAGQQPSPEPAPTTQPGDLSSSSESISISNQPNFNLRGFTLPVSDTPRASFASLFSSIKPKDTPTMSPTSLEPAGSSKTTVDLPTSSTASIKATAPIKRKDAAAFFKQHLQTFNGQSMPNYGATKGFSDVDVITPSSIGAGSAPSESTMTIPSGGSPF